MPSETEVARRLLGHYLRSFSIAELGKEVQQDPAIAQAVCWPELERILKHLEVADAEECKTTIAVIPSRHSVIRPIASILFLNRFGAYLPLAEIESFLDIAPGSDSVHTPVFRSCWRAYHAMKSGNSGQALEELGAHHEYLGPLAPLATVETAYAFCVLQRQLGEAYQRVGNLLLAFQFLRSARAISLSRGFAMDLACARDIGTLLWASGQLRNALETHLDLELRQRAIGLGNHMYLAKSYLSAAKCAIDLGSLDLAREELGKARELIAQRFQRLGQFEGYTLLFEGELRAREGRTEDAFDLLRQAESYFQTMKPEYTAGVMEARIAMAHVALAEGDRKLTLAIVRQLTDTAEEKGCLEARSRLLLLEISLKLTANPVLKEAYGDLVTRVHLINNPVLMLKALGDLFAHALEYLDEEEQAYLLERVDNLRHVIDSSCYDDLYREYITQRYASAIENRLRRHLRERGLPPLEPE